MFIIANIKKFKQVKINISNIIWFIFVSSDGGITVWYLNEDETDTDISK